MANVSLSTMWAQGRFQRLGEFVAAVRRMGFGGIEVNYTVDPRGLEELLADGDGAYPSFHSPVPMVKAGDGRGHGEIHGEVGTRISFLGCDIRPARHIDGSTASVMRPAWGRGCNSLQRRQRGEG